jgi:hypothetical protein
MTTTQGKLRDLPPGVQRTKAGHLRYTGGPHRGEYVHRYLYIKLMEETPYSIRLLLPFPFEVHHMDYNKENNKPHNLLGLDIKLHSAQTAHDRRRRGNGTFAPKWKAAPLCLPLFDFIDEDDPDVVPF